MSSASNSGDQLRPWRIYSWVKREALTLVVIGALGALAVAVSLQARAVFGLDGKLSTALDTRAKQMELSTPVTITIGGEATTINVTTTPLNDAETFSQMLDRHLAQVAAVRARGDQ